MKDRQELFDHMSQEHGLLLLESQMDEIESIVKNGIFSEVVRQFQFNDWTFDYDKDIRFVVAKHREGGRQSICEIVHPFERDAFGEAIANFLNDY